MKDQLPNHVHGYKRNFSMLLPYWGIEKDSSADQPIPGLQGKSVCIPGLSQSDFSELNRYLHHTGIDLQQTEKSGMPHFFIKIKNDASSRLTINDQKMTYHLKPLRDQTDDVQTWVHKHLWLPRNTAPFTLTFHPHDEINIPEWLCYLLIQYFMGPKLQSLSHLSYNEYEQAVEEILEPINPALAARQLSLGRRTHQDWPGWPPEQASGKTIDPFTSKHNTEKADPINPFRNQQKPTKPSTVNPFRKKT